LSLMTHDYLQVKKAIYGDILASDNVSFSLKKWRGIFNVSQVELAQEMGISSSVISEYENNPNRVPGTRFIKRYVEALIKLDLKRGGNVLKLLRSSGDVAIHDGILSIVDYYEPIPVSEYITATNSKVIVGGEKVKDTRVYGHTVIDSIVAILSMSGEGFYRIYGRSTERVLIFTNVSLGRSPLVAVRVYPLKPRAVVLHGPSRVDELGIKIAERENIILALSRAQSVEALIKAVNELASKYRTVGRG